MMDLSQAWTSLFVGLLAAGSPCLIPLYPGFLAYLGTLAEEQRRPGLRYFLGFFVLAGVMTMMLTLGAIIALLSVSIGQALAVIIPIADALLILLGILLLLGINPMEHIPQIPIPGLGSPSARAFLYGLLYGPISVPCAGPLVVSIFAISLTASEAFSRFLTFFWFGIGFGMPLLVLSLLTGTAQRTITRAIARHNRVVQIVSGALLVGLAIYDLWINWDSLMAL